jgi:predicted amidophosphoribosyltransferase
MSSPTTVQEGPPSRLARIARALRTPVRLALDVALPPLCPACREVVGESAGLCASCWSKLCPIERPFCERLGIPFVYDPGPGILDAGDRRSAGLCTGPRRGALR